MLLHACAGGRRDKARQASERHKADGRVTAAGMAPCVLRQWRSSGRACKGGRGEEASAAMVRRALVAEGADAAAQGRRRKGGEEVKEPVIRVAVLVSCKGRCAVRRKESVGGHRAGRAASGARARGTSGRQADGGRRERERGVGKEARPSGPERANGRRGVLRWMLRGHRRRAVCRPPVACKAAMKEGGREGKRERERGALMQGRDEKDSCVPLSLSL